MSLLQNFTCYNISTNATKSLLTNFNTLQNNCFILVFPYFYVTFKPSSTQNANHKIVHTWALICSACVHQNAQQC